jgi:hypothetical protein
MDLMNLMKTNIANSQNLGKLDQNGQKGLALLASWLYYMNLKNRHRLLMHCLFHWAGRHGVPMHQDQHKVFPKIRVSKA